MGSKMIDEQQMVNDEIARTIGSQMIELIVSRVKIAAQQAVIDSFTKTADGGKNIEVPRANDCAD